MLYFFVFVALMSELHQDEAAGQPSDSLFLRPADLRGNRQIYPGDIHLRINELGDTLKWLLNKAQ